MAVLSVTSRGQVSGLVQEDLSETREALGLTRPDLLAAINAVDQWAEDNKASFNSALPLPARTTLTASQKARLLMYVIRKRYEVGA